MADSGSGKADGLTRSGKAGGGSAETEVPAKKADGGNVEAKVQRPKTYQDHQDRSLCMFLYLKVNRPRAGLRIGPRRCKTHFYAAKCRVKKWVLPPWGPILRPVRCRFIFR
jgi:hypothetical protein